MNDTIKKADEHFGNRKFFIIEKIHYENIDDTYYVYDRKMYDLTTVKVKIFVKSFIKNLLILTLNLLLF